MWRLLVALTLGCATTLSPAFAHYDASAGRPAAKALPTYCQMGTCIVVTVEATDPVLFSSDGVMFRVESQNWEGGFNPKSLRRGADSVSYVLCSKRSPATVDQTGAGKFMVTFLAPNEPSTYGHANETALAVYFTVCHGRAFGDTLFDQGPAFASSLGYAVTERDDQPVVDSLERAMVIAGGHGR